MKYRKTSITFI